jgi:hypothetical protein
MLSNLSNLPNLSVILGIGLGDFFQPVSSLQEFHCISSTHGGELYQNPNPRLTRSALSVRVLQAGCYRRDLQRSPCSERLS